MTPAARLQAAIEILDEVIAAARDDGPPADTIVTRYFKTRRYAGSKDRRAVRELVFRAIRAVAETAGERPRGRAWHWRKAILHFSTCLASPGGRRRHSGEPVAERGEVPNWLKAELSPLVTPGEWPALLERAPLDFRVNAARASRDEILSDFEGAAPTPLSPWGIRLAARQPHRRPSGLRPGPSRGAGRRQPADRAGLQSRRRTDTSSTSAPGRAASRWRSPRPRRAQRSSRRTAIARASRSSPRGPTAHRRRIETRLLNPPNELQELADWRAKADLVLVDAPCSGSGTWRRNPEGRWRLNPERLDGLVALQKHLLDIAAELVRPGGRVVYAVCSLLSREGAGQIEDFLSRRSSWIVEETPIAAGRLDGAGRLLTPGHDATDGFFVARLVRAC